MGIAADCSQGTWRGRSRSTIPFRPALLALAIGQALLGMEAQAANFTVTNVGDSGPDTLRQAVIDAGLNAGPDYITFAPGLSGATITLTTGQIPVMGDDVTIDGDLNNDGIPDITVSGGNASRVFFFYQSRVALDGLTITGGNSVGDGGAIANFFGDLSVANSTVSGNSAVGGGGIFNYGSQFGGDATLTLSNSTVSGNTATGSAAGIRNHGKYANATLTVTDSIITGNQAVNGGSGGIQNFGKYHGNATLNVSDSIVTGNQVGIAGGGGAENFGKYHGSATSNFTNSTISGNTSGLVGGGVGNIGKYGDAALNVTGSTISGNSAAGAGGGIDNYSKYSANVTVTNSTISGNSAAGGGGVYSGAKYSGPNKYGTAVVTSVNSTIAGNSATAAGGGFYASYSLINLSNTIIAGSSSGGDCTAVGGTLATNVRNLIQDDSCGGVADLSGDPNLGPLQNNGGTTETHALLTSSIAIDAGNNGAAIAAGLTGDQRGWPRIQGANVDIGAYEYGQPISIAVPTMSQWAQSLFTVVLAGLGALGLRRRRRKDSG